MQPGSAQQQGAIGVTAAGTGDERPAGGALAAIAMGLGVNLGTGSKGLTSKIPSVLGNLDQTMVTYASRGGTANFFQRTIAAGSSGGRGLG